MSSHSSVVALGLGSQPGCSTTLPAQRNSFPGLHLLPPRSRSLTLLGQDDFFESFSGSFCDVSDALGPDLFDCSYSIPDPQLVRRIVSQVEFYLSDENLAKDAFLLKHVQKNKMGFVSIKLLTSFKKVKYLTRDWRLTLYALQFSELLEVNEEGTKVRRRVPLPESLLSIPPSKLLLAWDPLPQELGVLPPLQKNFIETITRMFSPFGAIASIRILRPGRKLPSDVRKYTVRFPELLSRCCALVEYESLESARRAFEDLSRPGSESIRVVRLSGKGSKKKSGAEREAAVEEMLGWKAQAAAAETFPYSLGDSLLCSSPESDTARASLPLLLSTPSWPDGHSGFKPGSFGSTFARSLLTSKVFPPLTTELSTGGCFGLGSSPESSQGLDFGWGSGVGAWAPWGSSATPGPSLDAKSPPSNPLAVKQVSESLGLRAGVLRLPHGPDGTKGFYNSIGRGKLVLRH
ncbi:la-related protein 6-like [Cygnus olor]|uniref:la-related protein 6-like n=1 Tax=Cygnus olor TaxID=8869 RepID=UPI001ADEA54E|nr:la-related protein 6-like [Cygnus olor]